MHIVRTAMAVTKEQLVRACKMAGLKLNPNRPPPTQTRKELPTKNFVYVVRDAINGQKFVGGTVHAYDMEDAGRRAINRCKLSIRQRLGKFYTDTDFLLDGRKVNLYVGVHPEYFLDAASVEVV